MSNQYPPHQPPPGPPPPAPYGYPPPYAPVPPTNTMSVVSLVTSLATFVIGIGWIPGIICGHIALRQIRMTGEAGEGMAKAGLIIGYIFGALCVLAVVAYILFFVFIFGMIGLAESSGRSV